MGGTASRGATTLQGASAAHRGPAGKKIGVINSGHSANTYKMFMEEAKGTEWVNCVAMAGDILEQAVIVLDKDTGTVTVVQPNKDGSYWRKIVQNKMVRTKEVWMVKAAKLWAADLLEMCKGATNPFIALAED